MGGGTRRTSATFPLAYVSDASDRPVSLHQGCARHFCVLGCVSSRFPKWESYQASVRRTANTGEGVIGRFLGARARYLRLVTCEIQTVIFQQSHSLPTHSQNLTNLLPPLAFIYTTLTLPTNQNVYRSRRFHHSSYLYCLCRSCLSSCGSRSRALHPYSAHARRCRWSSRTLSVSTYALSDLSHPRY